MRPLSARTLEIHGFQMVQKHLKYVHFANLCGFLLIIYVKLACLGIFIILCRFCNVFLGGIYQPHEGNTVA